ncbi:MAG: hypothetical protein ACLUVI_05385 [Acutalibacteraceae bacterium]
MQKDNSLETLYFARALFLPKRKIAGRFLSGGRKKINWIDRCLVGCALFVITLIFNRKARCKGNNPGLQRAFLQWSRKLIFIFGLHAEPS